MTEKPCPVRYLELGLKDRVFEETSKFFLRSGVRYSVNMLVRGCIWPISHLLGSTIRASGFNMQKNSLFVLGCIAHTRSFDIYAVGLEYIFA